MSSRKRKPKKNATPIEETLEPNVPHEVEIQEGEPAEAPLDPSDLPTVEMPVVTEEEARTMMDAESTVDLGAVEAEAEETAEADAEAVDALLDSLEPPTKDGEAENDAETVELQATGEAEASDSPAAEEDEGADSITTSATDRERAHLKGLVEALVFATDKPIKVGELARLADAAPKLIRSLLADLAEEYKPRGIHLAEVAGGYLFRTNVRYGSFVRELTQQKPIRLSRAQLEALAILAYRQPITRPEIDEIRGVDSGPVLKMLLERELVRILGKRDEVGRPIIYGTTPEFLEFFGLKSLKDLPNLREFTELTDESHAIAEKELGESWRGPGGGELDESSLPDEPGETPEQTEALDAEAERIVNESMVEHALPDDETLFTEEEIVDEAAEPTEEPEPEPTEEPEPEPTEEPTDD